MSSHIPSAGMGVGADAGDSHVGQDAARFEVLGSATLRGRSAFVSGAGSGIGRAVALRLVALGATVFGTGRREALLAETAEMAQRMRSRVAASMADTSHASGATGGEDGATTTGASPVEGAFAYEACNVRDTEAIRALIAKVGAKQGIDLLVNNAGGQFFAPATEISRKGWDAVVDLNLSAVFVITQAGYPYLRANRGTVVNLSLSGVDRGSKGIAHSIAARAGVLGMTRTLALEWALDGINLNCIGPGTVVTAGLEDEAAQPLLDTLLAATPMHQVTSVHEVAELIAYLASPAGKLMTGQMLQIDGGAHLGSGLHMIG